MDNKLESFGDEEVPNTYRELEEVCGSPFGSELNADNDDASQLYTKAERDFDATIPMILEELAANRSANLRESCVFLLDCFANPKYADQILFSLQREHTCTERVVAQYIYVNCLLTFGEPMLMPMLAIFRNTESDSYSKSVAINFLTLFLSKPVT